MLFGVEYPDTGLSTLGQRCQSPPVYLPYNMYYGKGGATDLC